MGVFRRKFLSLILTFVLVLVSIFMIIFSQEHSQNDPLVLTTFSLNILVSVCGLIYSVYKYSFSFDLMFWIFTIYFFGTVPMLQYLTNTYTWNLVTNSDEVLVVNIIVFVWILFYAFVRYSRIVEKVRVSLKNKGKMFFETRPHFFSKRPFVFVREKYDAIVCEKKYTIRSKILNVMLGISVLITIYYLIVVGFENLIFRSTSTPLNLNVAETLLLTHGFNNILLFTTVFSVLDAQNNGKINVRVIISFLCLVISCFPTGLARNMMASFYGGLFIIVLGRSKIGRWFPALILGGLIFVFPALNVFRLVIDDFGENFGALLTYSLKNAYLEGHYDAHQMIISFQHYIDKFGYCYFSQIWGAVLFFVPRAIWTSKPMGTGHTVISELEQYYFTNVSAPLMGEFYIGFGIVGVILGAIIIGRILKKIDVSYWNSTSNLSLIRVIYPFSMFMFFFLLRGDLLSSWAYTFAQLFVGTVIWLLVVKRECMHK